MERRRQKRTFRLPPILKNLNLRQSYKFPKKLESQNPKQLYLEQTSRSEKLLHVIETFGLTDKQVERFHKSFFRCQNQENRIEYSDCITITSIFKALDELPSKITRQMLLKSKTGECMCFDEFVVMILSFCLMSKVEILKEVFDYCDEDGSGFIDENEFKVLLHTVNQVPLFPRNFTNALQIADENGDGVIDFDEFKALNRRFPIMLFPIFLLQEKLQTFTLGEQSWIEIGERVERGRTRWRYTQLHGMNPPLQKKLIRRVTKLPRLPDHDKVRAIRQGRI